VFISVYQMGKRSNSVISIYEQNSTFPPVIYSKIQRHMQHGRIASKYRS